MRCLGGGSQVGRTRVHRWKGKMMADADIWSERSRVKRESWRVGMAVHTTLGLIL